jgi:transposase
MDWTGLKLLLEGIEPKQVRRRYKKPVGSARNPPLHPAKLYNLDR